MGRARYELFGAVTRCKGISKILGIFDKQTPIIRHCTHSQNFPLLTTNPDLDFSISRSFIHFQIPEDLLQHNVE